MVEITDSRNVDNLQRLVVNWADRQFPKRTVHQAISKLMLEEIPEFMQAYNEGNPVEDLQEEFGDLFILLLDVGHLLNLDIPTGILEKMHKNITRTWIQNPASGLYHHL